MENHNPSYTYKVMRAKLTWLAEGHHTMALPVADLPLLPWGTSLPRKGWGEEGNMAPSPLHISRLS